MASDKYVLNYKNLIADIFDANNFVFKEEYENKINNYVVDTNDQAEVSLKKILLLTAQILDSNIKTKKDILENLNQELAIFCSPENQNFSEIIGLKEFVGCSLPHLIIYSILSNHNNYESSEEMYNVIRQTLFHFLYGNSTKAVMESGKDKLNFFTRHNIFSIPLKIFSKLNVPDADQNKIVKDISKIIGCFYNFDFFEKEIESNENITYTLQHILFDDIKFITKNVKNYNDHEVFYLFLRKNNIMNGDELYHINVSAKVAFLEELYKLKEKPNSFENLLSFFSALNVVEREKIKNKIANNILNSKNLQRIYFDIFSIRLGLLLNGPVSIKEIELISKIAESFSKETIIIKSQLVHTLLTVRHNSNSYKPEWCENLCKKDLGQILKLNMDDNDRLNCIDLINVALDSLKKKEISIIDENLLKLFGKVTAAFHNQSHETVSEIKQKLFNLNEKLNQFKEAEEQKKLQEEAKEQKRLQEEVEKKRHEEAETTEPPVQSTVNQASTSGKEDTTPTPQIPASQTLTSGQGNITPTPVQSPVSQTPTSGHEDTTPTSVQSTANQASTSGQVNTTTPPVQSTANQASTSGEEDITPTPVQSTANQTPTSVQGNTTPTPVQSPANQASTSGKEDTTPTPVQSPANQTPTSGKENITPTPVQSSANQTLTSGKGNTNAALPKKDDKKDETKNKLEKNIREGSPNLVDGYIGDKVQTNNNQNKKPKNNAFGFLMKSAKVLTLHALPFAPKIPQLLGKFNSVVANNLLMTAPALLVETISYLNDKNQKKSKLQYAAKCFFSIVTLIGSSLVAPLVPLTGISYFACMILAGSAVNLCTDYALESSLAGFSSEKSNKHQTSLTQRNERSERSISA